MRLTFDALIVIDAIERSGSFAAAAETLHRVPSAITYTIQKLEESLGVALFDRSGHRARLTPAGKELVVRGRKVIEAGLVLEGTVKRIATGWESELRITVGDIIPVTLLFPLIERFYAEHRDTQLRISREVLGGSWDALSNDRADLVIGLPGEPPQLDGYASREIGVMSFAFVMAPDHPLAAKSDPITDEDVLSCRVVAAADSSRSLPPRSVGLLTGQDVLTVHDLETKRLAHLAGLGIGTLPRHMVIDDLAAGRLVERQRTSTPATGGPIHLAWNAQHQGNALEWFIEQAGDRSLYTGLFDPMM